MSRNRDISKLLSTSNGKIAGANLDVSFENITDTGTEGTRVALGTTAQRGSTTGQIRFNSTTGLAEYYTGTVFKTIDSPPTVSSVGATNITDAQISSNYDLSITGTNFQSGATVTFIGSDGTNYASPTVTVNSDTSISARVPTTVTNANEPFDVKVSNASGLSNTLADAFNVDSKPIWSTASGQVGGTIYENVAMSNTTLTATDPEGDTIAYSIQSGALPTGISLNSSTGVLSGTPTASITSDTTSNFTVRATSGTNTNDRSFNIVVKNTNSGNHNNAPQSGGIAWFDSTNAYYGIDRNATLSAEDLITTFKTRKSGTGNQTWWGMIAEGSTTSNGFVIIAAWKWTYNNSSDGAIITHNTSSASAFVKHNSLTSYADNKIVIPSGATASTGTGNYFTAWVSSDPDGGGSGSLYADASSGGQIDYIDIPTYASNISRSLVNSFPNTLPNDTVIVTTSNDQGGDMHVRIEG